MDRTGKMEKNTPPLSKLTKAYLIKYFEKKKIPYDEWNIISDGVTHRVSNKLVINLILDAHPQEQRVFVDALQDLESSNINVNVFLKNLAFESNILSHIKSH